MGSFWMHWSKCMFLGSSHQSEGKSNVNLPPWASIRLLQHSSSHGRTVRSGRQPVVLYLTHTGGTGADKGLDTFFPLIRAGDRSFLLSAVPVQPIPSPPPFNRHCRSDSWLQALSVTAVREQEKAASQVF